MCSFPPAPFEMLLHPLMVLLKRSRFGAMGPLLRHHQRKGGLRRNERAHKPNLNSRRFSLLFFSSTLFFYFWRSTRPHTHTQAWHLGNQIWRRKRGGRRVLSDSRGARKSKVQYMFWMESDEKQVKILITTDEIQCCQFLLWCFLINTYCFWDTVGSGVPRELQGPL